MIRAAQRMRGLGKRSEEGGAPSSIFGSALNLSQSIGTEENLRIGLYPILCADAPEMAMGLASCLAYLLEQYPDTRIYRCFTKIDQNAASGEITSEDYQFSPDDWELAGLADNVQIWGSLDIGDGVALSLTADVRLLSNEDDLALAFKYDSLASAVLGLPQVAAQVYEALVGGAAAPAIVGYSDIGQGDLLDQLLPMVFDWNLDVYLQLWGEGWDERDLLHQFDEALAFERRKEGDFAAWCLGMMAKQVMQPGLDELGEALVARAFEVVDELSLAAMPALAQGLAALDYYDEAAKILEQSLEPDSDPSIWHSLAEILQDAGKFYDAVVIAQEALEAGLQHPALYMQYARLLMSAETTGWTIDEVLLIDPDEVDEDAQIQQEIANALKLCLAQAPDDLEALQLALMYMMSAEDDETWIYLERLVKADSNADYLHEVLFRLADIDDWSPAKTTLEGLVDENPHAFAFLAQIAVDEEDFVRAAEWIEKSRAASNHSQSVEQELQRIDLQIRAPGFAQRFAEIKLELRAGNRLSDSQISLLESACEIAPQLAEMHITLAYGYMSWDDMETALEVTREAHASVGTDPQFALGMAQLQWRNQQQDEALATLTYALDASPNEVSLLTQMANFLLANGQMDAARDYLALAESISPSDQALARTKATAARLQAQKT